MAGEQKGGGKTTRQPFGLPPEPLSCSADWPLVGWREWVALTALGIPAIKAKVDTGARTSVLHAFCLETFERDDRPMVRFGIHPLQRRTDIEIFCVAEIVDRRLFSDSGGHRERRLVIRSPLTIGKVSWEVEMSLTNRDPMLFRLLLGRSALRGRAWVDPAASYLTGRALARSYRQAIGAKMMR
jgi:hypothetical protein